MILLFLSFFVGTAYGLRCGTRLICLGDPKSKILHECGEPDDIAIRYEEYSVGYNHRPYLYDWEYKGHVETAFSKEVITIEEWMYNFGSSRFIRFLVFVNGRLREIRTGGYGY
jgi:hypothetical protein